MISISKRELFIKSWILFKENLSFLFNLGILLFSIQHIVPMMMNTLITNYSITYIIFHIIYLFITTTVSLWSIAQILNIIKQKKIDEFANITTYSPLVLRSIAGSFILTFSLILIGISIFTLFSDQLNVNFETANFDAIFQAIQNSTLISIILISYIIASSYIWVKSYFFIYFIIDDKMGALQAIKYSFKVTNGYEADLFILWFSTICINFIGLLLYGVGLIFALPFSMMVLSLFYYKHLYKIKIDAKCTNE